MKYIDKEEKELIESYHKGEWKSAKNKNKQTYVEGGQASRPKKWWASLGIGLSARPLYT